MRERRVIRTAPRATGRDQVAVGVASVVAPVPATLYLRNDVLSTVLATSLVTTLIAAALLVGVTPPRHRRALEVGTIWVFAGAASALAFTEPTLSHLDTSSLEVVVGAIIGVIAWPCFVVVHRFVDKVL